MSECPKCFLPSEEGAWRCDGCGYEFSQDFAAVRADLALQLRKNRASLWVTLVVGLGVAGGLVYLATLGYIYISVGLMLAVVGSIGFAIQKASALRGHLRDLDRRYVPLPTATAQLPDAKRGP